MFAQSGWCSSPGLLRIQQPRWPCTQSSGSGTHRSVGNGLWPDSCMVSHGRVFLNSLRTPVRAKRKNWQRMITWFNPLFSQNVATNVGWRFRTLIRKHFPRSSQLHKIFNANTLKLSYSCLPNMAAVIRQHNSAAMRIAQPFWKILPVRNHATVGPKTVARWAVWTKSARLSTRPPLLLDQEKTRGTTPAWLHKHSNSDSIPTNCLFGTRNTRTARLCRRTSGP